ncbi:MAG: Glutamate racemase [Candidatus Bathyarchaeota archaeon BA1]|nr:MAG: Glutamate racemase [Candidatus Bathyarchaeota archaeon BA1]
MDLGALIGLIRVVTLTDKTLLNLHGRIVEDMFPELKVISQCIKGHPKGLYNFESERKAIPKIISLGKTLENEGAQAIIVSCANDPGVNELREATKVPIIGAGSACASLASMYGRRIGVLGITDIPPHPMVKVLGEKLVAYEKPYNVKTTLDLAENVNAIFESAKKLVNQSIDVLALGCTGYSTLRIADKL